MVVESWHDTLDRVLNPVRPDLARCLLERKRHQETQARVAEARVHALMSCERRINEARAAVLASNDGVVTSRMTDLEREWRRLSRARVDPEAGIMDLWSRIA